MIRKLRLLPLLGLFFAVLTGQGEAVPVEYVKICSVFGADFFYVPGRETCVNASTGEERVVTEAGMITTDSELARRVRALESDNCDGCFASIKADGTTSVAGGLTATTHTAVGQYELQFERDVRKCSPTATLMAQRRSHVPNPGLVVVGFGKDSKRSVAVYTYSIAGQLKDRDFNVSLACVQKDDFCERDKHNDGTKIVKCDKDDYPQIP